MTILGDYMDTKECVACGETKHLSEFWRKSSGRGGLQARCKACIGMANKATLLRSTRIAQNGLKQCAACGETKPTDQFPRNSSCADGLHYRCKACHYQSHRLYLQDPEHRATVYRQRRRKMGEPAVKAAYHDRKIRNKYGLPREWTYEGMLAMQDGKCAICDAEHNGGFYRFAIDHNPASGEVRGLLCTQCNQALGQLRESPDLLRKAAAYLENPPGPQIPPPLKSGGG